MSQIIKFLYRPIPGRERLRGDWLNARALYGQASENLQKFLDTQLNPEEKGKLLASSAEAVARLETEKADLAKQIDSLRQDKQSLSEQLAATDIQRLNAEKVVATLKEERDGLQQIVAAGNTELGHLRPLNQQLVDTSRLSKAQEDLAALNTAKSLADQDLQRLTAELSAKTTEVATLQAAVDDNNAKAVPFDVVLQRVAKATKSNDWTKDGWSDLQLESSLTALLDRLHEITKKKNMELPVEFDSVRPAKSHDGSRISYLTNELFVTKRGTVSHAQDSIILADESIEVSHASNCLIIARGTVDIGHGTGNLIIAGYFAHTSHDRPDTRKPDAPKGSVLIAGAVVDVSHAYDTIVCAPLAATISHSTNVIFINSPNRNISHEHNSTYLTDDSQTLPTVFAVHPMINKLKVTRIVQDSLNGAYVETRHAGVIRIGHDIPNATDELKGWKLVFVGEECALFAKDGQYAGTGIVPRN